MKRGEIWWASLTHPNGSGPGYRRPFLIVQANSFNVSQISTVLVAAITSNLALASAPGNSRGQAKVFTDMKIKMKDSTIQVRGFAPIGMLGLWNIGHPVKLFCAIIGSGLPASL